MPSSEESCLRSWGCLTCEVGYRQADDALSELRTDTMDPRPLITAGLDPHSQTSPAPPSCRALPDVAEGASWQRGAALMLIKSSPQQPQPPRPARGTGMERGQPRVLSRQEAAPTTAGMPSCWCGLIEQLLHATSKLFSTGFMGICF